MKRESKNKWVAVVPEQTLCVARSEGEASATAHALLKGTAVAYEVRLRTHEPEQCWCGDDHSP